MNSNYNQLLSKCQNLFDGGEFQHYMFRSYVEPQVEKELCNKYNVTDIYNNEEAENELHAIINEMYERKFLPDYQLHLVPNYTPNNPIVSKLCNPIPLGDNIVQGNEAVEICCYLYEVYETLKSIVEK